MDMDSNQQKLKAKGGKALLQKKIENSDGTSIAKSVLAFLQYRSGSADTPKGAIKVICRELYANVRSIMLVMPQTFNIVVSCGPESKYSQHGIVDLSWLPQGGTVLPNDKQESKENELLVTANLNPSKIDINLKQILLHNSMNESYSTQDVPLIVRKQKQQLMILMLLVMPRSLILLLVHS